MKFIDFLPWVHPDVPGCPIPTIQARLGTVLDEFCRKTLCWNEWMEPITLVAGESQYDVDVDGNPYIVMSASCDGKPMGLTSEADLRLETQHWQAREAVRPSACFLRPDGVLVVFPRPTESGGVVLAQVAMTPRLPVSKIDDQIARFYTDGIASGVLARLMAMRKTEWGQPDAVQYHQDRFQSAIGEALANRAHGFTQSDVYVPPRKFG